MNPVVIIGGGPAGSALGCYLSLAGIKNRIFERAFHPRAHVGESLVSSTTRVFQDIGFVQKMDRGGFVRKYGAAWHPTQKHGTVSIEFREFPNEGVFQDYSYHVDRSKFDLLMLQHAAELGSGVYQGVQVKKALQNEDGAVNGVTVEMAGENIDVPASIVVDASGRNTLLGNQLGLKKNDPLFNQFSVHAWFEGVDTGPVETAEDIHIYFLPIERGWAWQIPITDTVTSIGVVAEKSVFKASKNDPESWFNEQIATTPDIQCAMRDARRINEFKIEGDYSYSMERFCGDGYLLIGDACRFVDPIFSSGVSVALHSAKIAAQRIKLAYKCNDVSKKVLMPYEENLRKGTTIWYEFIRLYYKVLPLFTYFIQHKDYRQELFQLLQGEVYCRERASVLDAMRNYINSIESTENHLLQSQLDPSISV